ncbi:MAG TPA: glycosyltransferase [Thermoanaerobaculia bacterium]|nr:glycosyltransferase [Thermoanaerobaculia bacterium]
MRVLHAIHDFLPRHRAGSELYCLELCLALQRLGTATHVLCADYDPRRPHGELVWRAFEGVGVTELINNWAFAGFAESYASPAIERRLSAVLDMLQPDLLHVHNLLNLSFALPAMARRRGIPVVATLHDYTLVCPSGGQRVHVAEEHVCRVIESSRCARCFPQHPLYAQLRFGTRALRAPGSRLLGGWASAIRRRLPRLAAGFGRWAVRADSPLSSAAIEARLAAARRVFDTIDLFVAPSQALAEEYRRLGIPSERLRVADYGFAPLASRRGDDRARPRRQAGDPLRVGFVGTLVWHKGAHLLLAAAATLPPASFEVVLFGDPDVFPDYTSRLRRAAAALPVRFAGPFDHRDTADVYSQIDVLVVPSLWPENSPLVIHEAFQAGVPVIGARIGGIPELVQDGVSGLLYDAFSPAALAAALRRLLDEPGLRERLAAGVPPVKSIDEDAAEWQRVYAGLIGGRSSAS